MAVTAPWFRAGLLLRRGEDLVGIMHQRLVETRMCVWGSGNRVLEKACGDQLVLICPGVSWKLLMPRQTEIFGQSKKMEGWWAG